MRAVSVLLVAVPFLTSALAGSPDQSSELAPTSVLADSAGDGYYSYVSALDSSQSVESEQAAVSYARVSQTGTDSLAEPWSYSLTDTVSV